MKKVLISLFILFSLLTSVSQTAFADTAVSLCDSKNGSFSTLCSLKADQLSSIIPKIVNVLLLVAVVLSLVYLLWGGIKYIQSGGDKTKIDSARQHIIAAIVGLVISFLAFFIITLIGQIFGVHLENNFQLPCLVGSKC